MSTTELLTDHYPQVPVKDIHACLRYAADAVNERVASLRQPPARNPAGLMPGRWVSVGQATRGPPRRRKGGLVAGCRCRAGGTSALPVRPHVAGGSGSVAQVQVGPQLRRGHRLAARPGGHVACIVGGHRCQPLLSPGGIRSRFSVPPAAHHCCTLSEMPQPTGKATSRPASAPTSFRPVNSRSTSAAIHPTACGRTRHRRPGTDLADHAPIPRPPAGDWGRTRRR